MRGEQLSIWDFNDEVMSVSDAASSLKVSSATVRNWTKTGLLRMTSDSYVTMESIKDFINNETSGKLNSRANKLRKNSHDHLGLSNAVFSEIASGESGKVLCREYESSLSEAYKNEHGIYYTPKIIVSDLMADVKETDGKLFLEPCCGGGNFIISALEHGFSPDNIYAYDVDKNAVEIAQKRFYEMTGHFSSHIVCADFLEIGKHLPERFDYIFTNPPWGEKFAKNIKNRYAKLYGAGDSTDTCSLFFFACLSLLKKEGELGFLLPESFFNISVFEYARKAAEKKSIERLVDYGKPFSGLMTKAYGIVLKNVSCPAEHRVKCTGGGKSVLRNQLSFSSMPKNIFNFKADNDTVGIIEHVLSFKHTTLKNKAEWGLGIVSGNNKDLCTIERAAGSVPLFRGKDITAKGLLKPSLFIKREDISRCQQVAPVRLYEAKEKLIYRFISNKLVFYCDTEQRFILNSANMLILDDSFPVNSRQLADLLNSKFMNWLFHNIFDTHKILRGDLELLPLPTDYFLTNGNFEESSFLDFLDIEERDGTYRIKS